MLEDAASTERDKLVVRLLADTGIRLGELLALRPKEREAAIRRALRTSPPRPDEPLVLRAWRAWALSGRRL